MKHGNHRQQRADDAQHNVILHRGGNERPYQSAVVVHHHRVGARVTHPLPQTAHRRQDSHAHQIRIRHSAQLVRARRYALPAHQIEHAPPAWLVVSRVTGLATEDEEPAERRGEATTIIIIAVLRLRAWREKEEDEKPQRKKKGVRRPCPIPTPPPPSHGIMASQRVQLPIEAVHVLREAMIAAPTNEEAQLRARRTRDALLASMDAALIAHTIIKDEAANRRLHALAIARRLLYCLDA